ncbi:MAG TPA: hypothetical protein V6D19_21355, partial [Stenomitos sp.]
MRGYFLIFLDSLRLTNCGLLNQKPLYIEIPVTVTAVTTDGTSQRFRGSYVLRRVNDVPGSTPEQRKWHLYSANLT